MGTAIDVANAFGYLTTGELHALQALVKQIPANSVVVNVGAGSGTSGLALAESRDDILLYTIDNSPSGPLGGMENERNAFDASPFANIPERWPNQVLGDSREIAKRWYSICPSLIDFIFIDDGHLEPEITGDILGWQPHMTANGIMVFHDYGSHHWPDVKKVVDKLMKPYDVISKVDTLIAFRLP